MAHTGPAYRACGKNALTVLRLRLDDAVGRHQNAARKLGKLFLLILPGAAVIADQMRISLELRVSVGGQHLAVRVDIDARIFGLLQQSGQIAQVVTGHQNGLAFDRGSAHLGRLLRTESAGVRLIQ